MILSYYKTCIIRPLFFLQWVALTRAPSHSHLLLLIPTHSHLLPFTPTHSHPLPPTPTYLQPTAIYYHSFQRTPTQFKPTPAHAQPLSLIFSPHPHSSHNLFIAVLFSFQNYLNASSTRLKCQLDICNFRRSVWGSCVYNKNSD